MQKKIAAFVVALVLFTLAVSASCAWSQPPLPELESVREKYVTDDVVAFRHTTEDMKSYTYIFFYRQGTLRLDGTWWLNLDRPLTVHEDDDGHWYLSSLYYENDEISFQETQIKNKR